MTLLSDPNLEVTRAWGLINPDRTSLPDPTAVVVDDEGIVRYLRRDHDFRTRPPAADLLRAVRGLDRDAPQ